MSLPFEEFRRAYRHRLHRATARRIAERLHRHAAERGEPLVLLCHEPLYVPGQWCHRTLFSEWWLEQTGELVEEAR